MDVLELTEIIKTKDRTNRELKKRFHRERKMLQAEIDAWKGKYFEISDARKAIGTKNAIIVHLEKQLEIANGTIYEYQVHYRKYGSIYRDFEEKRYPHPNPHKSKKQGILKE